LILKKVHSTDERLAVELAPKNAGRGVSVSRENLAGGGRAAQSKNATRLSHSTPRVAGTAQNSNLAFRSSAVSLWLEVISG
jgi:hypothetical protein